MKAHQIIIIALAALLLAASGMYVSERKAHDQCREQAIERDAQEQAQLDLANIEVEKWRSKHDTIVAQVRRYMESASEHVNNANNGTYQRDRAMIPTASDSALKRIIMWK